MDELIQWESHPHQTTLAAQGPTVNLVRGFTGRSKLCVAVAPALVSIRAAVTSMHPAQACRESSTGDHVEDGVVRFNGSGS